MPWLSTGQIGLDYAFLMLQRIFLCLDAKRAYASTLRQAASGNRPACVMFWYKRDLLRVPIIIVWLYTN